MCSHKRDAEGNFTQTKKKKQKPSPGHSKYYSGDNKQA